MKINPTDFFYLLEKTPLSDYREVFSSFQSNLFRYEALPKYKVPSEDLAFSEFKLGKTSPSENFLQGWHDFISQSTQDGKEIERVRKLSCPRTEYENFEVQWGYTKNLEKGERIRYFDCENQIDITKHIPIDKDFWLVDEKKCFLVEYDQEGMFLGASEVPEEYVHLYVTFKKVLLKKSEPLII